MNALHPYAEFVERFFAAYGCPVLEKGPMHFTVQLTSDMDEEIMNRPFYWHYMKKMKREGDPMRLTFTQTDSSHKQGIYLHAGTPKLHALYQTAINKGKTARLYEQIPPENAGHTAVSPWLVVNFLLHYRGKQARDEPLSIGLNLIHGTMMLKMMEKLGTVPFGNTVSDYTFPMTPVISLNHAYRRMEKHVETYISSQNNQWAVESHQHLQRETALLESFYESEDIDLESFTKERDQIDIRYKPSIKLEVVNGGLFYISKETSDPWIQQKSR
ncbi:YqhG family protein [Halobacillus litoralis]|uniref:YqhG family protein n=1 Tax=Halobacillus litoralis TaxID=45668 RepID=UPI001CD61EFD|nr:YqhG family protein [Halobacillus litoralis]MCA1023015.1 YqhG family protein [Halobacillus litoralis]